MQCIKKLICLKIELKDKSWACASAHTHWKRREDGKREMHVKDGEESERLELQQAELKIDYVVVDKNDRYLWVRAPAHGQKT